MEGYLLSLIAINTDARTPQVISLNTEVVTISTSMPPVTPDVVIMTTAGVASDDKASTMTTHGHQRYYRLERGHSYVNCETINTTQEVYFGGI